MSTRFSQADKYRDEIVQMEDEKYGSHHHHHVTHNTDPRNEGPTRVRHREPHDRRSPTSSNKAKQSSGSASKRYTQSKSTSANPHQPEE